MCVHSTFVDLQDVRCVISEHGETNTCTMNTEENKSSSDSLTRRNKQQKVLLMME